MTETKMHSFLRHVYRLLRCNENPRFFAVYSLQYRVRPWEVVFRVTYRAKVVRYEIWSHRVHSMGYPI